MCIQKIIISILLLMCAVRMNPQQTVHVIQPGETFETIAQKYSTTVQRIKELNPGRSDYCGQELVVPLPYRAEVVVGKTKYILHDVTELLDSLYNAEKYEKVIEWANKAIQARRSSGEIYNLTFADILMYKASSLYHLERPGAVEPCKEATLLVKKLIGKYNVKYKYYVTSLASYCYFEDIYPDCILYENEALDVAEKLGEKEINLDRLVKMCKGKSNEELGIDKVHLVGRGMFDYFGTTSLGDRNEIGNLVNARKNYDKVKQETNGQGIKFADAEQELALSYIAIGDTASARELLYDAACWKHEDIGENSEEFLRADLLYMGVCAIEGQMLKDQEQTLFAKNEGLFILNKLEELKLTRTSTYIDALIFVGLQYAHIVASKCSQIEDALRLSKEIFGPESPEYDRARFAYAQILYRSSSNGSNRIGSAEMAEIINLTNESYLWRKKNLGPQHHDCLICLLALATYYDHNHQYKEANELFGTFVNLQTNIVTDNFIGMTYEQQRDYWHLYSNYFKKSIPRVLWNASQSKDNRVDASVCYDATLFSKSLLLKSFMARHESELTGNKESYDRFVRNLSHTWKDVQKELNRNEAAIEFVSFKDSHMRLLKIPVIEKRECYQIPVSEDNQSIYGALIIKKQMTSPVFVLLCDLNSIGEIEINGHMQSDMLYKTIWQPLLPYLKDVSTIYFSPSDDFYNIPLESLVSSKDGKPISDTYRLYRLSSTGELAEKENNFSGDGAVIYGGINYGMSLSAMSKIKSSNNNPVSKTSLTRGYRESEDDIQELPGTAIEARNIFECINSATNKVGQAQMLTGDKATETSFKDLSGQKIKAMHIGTHGFYEPELENESLVNSDMDITLSYEDKALTRSGLLFAGAQNLLSGQTVPQNIDDGILTAYEVSYLDLYGLDMLTLSACQTGLGDITSDGVFGLQRGFKKAGANSILMSLWKVDDKATQVLMTEFYSNWINRKMSKHDALEAAKRTIRETKGWDDSRYWAAFILLDALD